MAYSTASYGRGVNDTGRHRLVIFERFGAHLRFYGFLGMGVWVTRAGAGERASVHDTHPLSENRKSVNSRGDKGNLDQQPLYPEFTSYTPRRN